MGRAKQCYIKLGVGSKLATHASSLNEPPLFKGATGSPVLYFPDGGYCFEFNAYLATIFLDRSYSLVGDRGGTYAQIAADLSHLMRHMHSNRICAMQMSDSRFMGFIDGLNVGRNPDGSPLRDPGRIRAIGSTCLDFLHHMGIFHHRSSFVAPDGCNQGVPEAPTSNIQEKSSGSSSLVSFSSSKS